MIKEIRLQNFKSHAETIVEFGNLTLLCGANGVGKSSSLQALLLLRDNYIKERNFDNLDLKSNSVKIGTAGDAIYQYAEEDGFTINFSTSIDSYFFKYSAVKEEAKVKSFINLIDSSSNQSIEKENLFSNKFQYISANRLGPQEQYPKDDKIVDIRRQISEIDGKAEYFVHFLNQYRDLTVAKALCIKNDYDDLFSQVIAWEQEISSGINIDIRDQGKLGFTLKYSFETNRGSTGRTSLFEASNVGFGISYVMPIIIAILSAEPGALLIIENPEAHLHPHGISKLTELICLAAELGIQIIIETHSDHVINGVLVQCKRFEEGNEGILKDNVKIYHFDRDEINHCTVANKIKLESGGRLRYPPKGFFDQFTIDRKFLMGF